MLKKYERALARAAEAQCPSPKVNWDRPELFWRVTALLPITGQVIYVDCGYQIMGM